MTKPTVWSAFNDGQGQREARSLCLEVLARAGPGAGRVAVDLGCGAGIETQALLSAGWTVHAIDSEPGTADRVHRAVAASLHSSLTVLEDKVDLQTRLPSADLLYAGFSLPFLPVAEFQAIWANLTAVLNAGGWFAGNFLGDRDSWRADETIMTIGGTQVRDLFGRFEIESFVEHEFDGAAFTGPKHWHRFDVIARKRL